MRTMLLPLAREETDDKAIDIGFSLARVLESHPTFLLARPAFDGIPVYAHSVTAAGYAAMMYDLKTDAELRESTVRQKLLEAAAKRGIRIATQPGDNAADATFEVGLGDDEEVITRMAAVNDLIVFPRVSRSGESLEAPSLLKTALEYSGRPILVITDDVPKDFGSTVAIAWNGSAEGARAVSAALPILSGADDVVILTAITAKTKAGEGERLRAYLSRYGIRSRTERLDYETSVGQELISAASRSGATLLVSGGYTHSRMRQTLFGGVTHQLLENCSVPLLLAH